MHLNLPSPSRIQRPPNHIQRLPTVQRQRLPQLSDKSEPVNRPLMRKHLLEDLQLVLLEEDTVLVQHLHDHPTTF